MLTSKLPAFAKSLFKSSLPRRPRSRRSTPRLQLEALENRLLLATHTWTGQGGIPLWSFASNWLEGQTPAGDPSADLIFPQDASLKQNFDNIPGALSIHSLSFTGNAYTLSPLFGAQNFFALLGGSTVASTADTQGTHLINRILINLELQTNSEVTGHTFTVTAFSNLELEGHISGVPLATLVKNGGGFLFVRPASPPNDYLGPTFVTEGALFTVGGIELEPPPPNNSSPLSPFSAVSFASGTEFQCLNVTTVGSLSGTGALIDVDQPLTTGFDARTTTFDGTIIGSAISGGTMIPPLTKVGAGTWTVSGSIGRDPEPSGTFPVRVLGGSLIFNGSADQNTDFTAGTGLSIFPFGLTSGLLGGSGTVNTVNVQGGILAPGGPGPAIFHTGNVSFSSRSFLFFSVNPTFQVKLQGTTPGIGYDQLSANGSVDLGSTTQLSVSLGFASAVGDTFTIIAATGGVTGTFSGLPDNQIFNVGSALFRINYTGTSVILTHVAGGAPVPAPPGAGLPGLIQPIDPPLSRTVGNQPVLPDAAFVEMVFAGKKPEAHKFARLHPHYSALAMADVIRLQAFSYNSGLQES